MLFNKSLNIAKKKIEDQETTHNQLFLVGRLKENKLKTLCQSSTGSIMHTARGNEEVICKVTELSKIAELPIEPNLYSQLRIVAGVLK